MVDEDVLGKLLKVIAELLKTTRGHASDLNAQTARQTDLFTGLGFDSVEALDLLSLLEIEFGLTIDPSNLTNKRTIGDIEQLLINHLNAAKKDSGA